MATSLFQYEKYHKDRKTLGYNSSMNMSLLTSHSFGMVVTGYNSECSSFISNLRTERMDVANRLSGKLADNPSYIGMRNEGVKLAWEYEKADIKMGGKGSANWTPQERQEILDHDSVRGAEGHHGKNVADHPEGQADPDNIHFYKTRQQHLQEGHDGDWKNSSEMPEYNKEKMLIRTNAKRVIVKELQGIALTAGIAFGIGASIEVISTLACEGISIRTVRLALKNGLKAGLKCAAFAVGTYLISRLISTILEKVVGISAAWAGELASPIVTAIFACVEFFMLKKAGYSNYEAIKKATINAIIRLAIWALHFIPYCGQILSIVATVVYTGVELALGIKEENLYRELEFRTVEWALPEFA